MIEENQTATMEEVIELERGQGQGVGGPVQGDGGASKCRCPKCGATITHQRGVPCTQIRCPKCGSNMVGI